MIRQLYFPGWEGSAKSQFTVGFGGGVSSCRTRGESWAHPHSVVLPTRSEIVAVQNAMDTPSLVWGQLYCVADIPLPPVSVPVT